MRAIEISMLRQVRYLLAASVARLVLGSWAALAADGIAPIAPGASDSLVILPSYNPDTPPDLLDGTLSGIGDEEENDEQKRGFLRFPDPLQPWLEFKQNVLQQDYGFSIGGSEGILGQDFSNSLTNNHYAVGQKFTLNVGQQILFRGTPDVMTIEAVIEDRGPVGTEFAPLQGGLRTGSSTATASTWGDFNLGVTQLYVRQDLLNHHFQYTFGKIFAPNYVNPYPLFDDNRQYLNQMYTTSVTIPIPLRGFGAVAALYPTNMGLYAKAGIYTVYSDDVGFTADSFFNRPQYFRHLELGWSGLAGTGTPIQGRGPMDANNLSITLWSKDANFDTGEAKSRGIAFNGNYQFRPDMLAFLRGGWSEGWQLDRSLNAGWGWRPFQQYSDLVGLAAGWAEPANHALRDQYVAEGFYRFQLTSQIALTPDLQWILHPTLNPNVGSLWVGSLRARITF
jgi:porin